MLISQLLGTNLRETLAHGAWEMHMRTFITEMLMIGKKKPGGKIRYYFKENLYDTQEEIPKTLPGLSGIFFFLTDIQAKKYDFKILRIFMLNIRKST